MHGLPRDGGEGGRGRACPALEDCLCIAVCVFFVVVFFTCSGHRVRSGSSEWLITLLRHYLLAHFPVISYLEVGNETSILFIFSKKELSWN